MNPTNSDCPYDAILFDFDGVLADTEPLHFECWLRALEPAGIAVGWERFPECVGLSEKETAAFFGRAASPPRSFEEIWQFYPAKQAMFRERVLAQPPIGAATLELLRTLDGVALAVVSSSATAEIRPVLETAGLLDCFATLVFAEDVERHKPAPDPYLKAAERLGAKRPLVVEDSDAGVASARAAGFDVLLVADPARTAELVRAALAQF